MNTYLLILSASLAFAGTVFAASRTCHGSVTRLNPTGTASGGVAGSQREVRYDLAELEKRRSCYQQAADKNSCLIETGPVYDRLKGIRKEKRKKTWDRNRGNVIQGGQKY
ncbi:goose-type lysozyme 2 [Plakobranchus ocellatus]|uniref:Goose-type lysozyme 2 n=1 Tax=Plakobranchus ocellatus TaxID=259542 RepID=A0AAV3ZPW1_9GAST|nr:goose-type lysozyme 2 [Plakobranchus ocellatus]